MGKYLLFQAARHTLGRLPLSILYRLVCLIADICYLLLARQRANVWDNMRHVLGPQASEEKLRAAARQAFRNVALYYADLIRMPRLDLEDFPRRRLAYPGFYENFLPALAAGKGVILVSAHFGNPELAIQALLPQGIKVFALTEPLQPPRLSRLVDGLRSSLGHTFRPVSVANVKVALRTLRSGGVVALMMDRDIEGPRARLPFCSEETDVPTGPVEVALRTGAALVPAFSFRREFEKLEVNLEEPLEPTRSGDFEADVRDNTRRLLARLEHHLRQRPGQWMVLERIWEQETGVVREAVAGGRQP
jgi:KDO2-lipid IV(A) lauroyltransferase